MADHRLNDEVVDGLFPTAYQPEVSPDALMGAREKLARRIVERGDPRRR